MNVTDHCDWDHIEFLRTSVSYWTERDWAGIGSSPIPSLSRQALHALRDQEVVMTTIAPSQIAFKEILVASDLSDVSEKAIGYAKSIARRFGSHLLLAHISEPANPVAIPEGEWIPDDSESHVEEQVEAAGVALRAEGFSAEAVNNYGPVKYEIEALAADRDADLIVLGTHARHGFERFILGSKAEGVMRSAGCPVIAVGPLAGQAPEGPWAPKNILCATSLDPHAVEVVAYGYALSQTTHAAFTLLSVADKGGSSGEEGWQAFQKSLARALPEMDVRRCQVHNVRENEQVADNIVDVARTLKADLIVMGAKSSPPGATHLAPGVLAKVLAEAPCPILSIHVGQAPFEGPLRFASSCAP